MMRTKRFANIYMHSLSIMTISNIQLEQTRNIINSKIIVSASSPLVGFGELNDNTIKGLISLLSVEQEIKYNA